MKWIIFFKERTPLVSYVLLAMGPALSAGMLAHQFHFSLMAWAFMGFFLFLIVLRMMDEFKDFDKDILAHCSRPLPRGLIALAEFHRGIFIGLLILIIFDLCLLYAGHFWSFILYSVVIGHLWLMYKEFYIPRWLNERPIIYAITHQLILIGLCFFCLSLFKDSGPELFYSRLHWGYVLSVLFSFFSYEICRKLDPLAHPVLKTYLSLYGVRGVLIIVGILEGLHILTLYFLFQENLKQFIFYIPIALLLMSLLSLTFEKIKFKTVELMATLNLIIFLYFGIWYVFAN